jgi:hypothetical protein
VREQQRLELPVAGRERRRAVRREVGVDETLQDTHEHGDLVGLEMLLARKRLERGKRDQRVKDHTWGGQISRAADWRREKIGYEKV